MWFTLLTPNVKKNKQKKQEGRRERNRQRNRESILSSSIILWCSSLLATRPSIFSPLRWGWTVSRRAYGFEGKVHLRRSAGALVGNVYHLRAVRTYALCGSVIRSHGEKHKQLMVGRWRSDGGREVSWGIGRRTGRWISDSRFRRKKREKLFKLSFLTFLLFGGGGWWRGAGLEVVHM